MFTPRSPREQRGKAVRSSDLRNLSLLRETMLCLIPAFLLRLLRDFEFCGLLALGQGEQIVILKATDRDTDKFANG